MPEGCPCVADPSWTLFKRDREKMWHYSLWRRHWPCRYQSVPLTLSTHITSPYSIPLGTAFFTSRASFLWCEAKDEARWQLWHCVGHRRPTWTSLEDWKQQGTVTPGNSCVYFAFMVWISACLTCWSSPRFPQMKYFPYTRVEPRHEPMCMQHRTWHETPSQPAQHCAAMEDPYEHPGMLWTSTDEQHLQLSLWQSPTKKTLCQDPNGCARERENRKLCKGLCNL